MPLVVELLRLQRERPYIVVVDTGSDEATCRRLEASRADDCEIHYLRGHAYNHSSEPVALACDLAMIRCKTEYLFFTHADCFLRRRRVLGDFVARCSAANPVVGYQLTDRSHITAEWAWMVGHTATMVHMPTMHRRGLGWGWDWGRHNGVRPDGEVYFDTETEFNWGLRRAGITPDLVGTERNYARNLNDDFDHPRSWASSRIYRNENEEYNRHKDQWMADAMAEARRRIALWKNLETAKARKSDCGCQGRA